MSYTVTWRGTVPADFTERLSAAAARLLAAEQSNARDAGNVTGAQEVPDGNNIAAPSSF